MSGSVSMDIVLNLTTKLNATAITDILEITAKYQITQSTNSNCPKKLLFLMNLICRVSPLETSLGNLSLKNISCSKSRQVTGRRFSGPNFRQKSRTGFYNGDRILNRTLDRLSSRTGHAVLFKKTVLDPV